MAKINIESEILANHTDEEIIEYIDNLTTGILKNYRIALTSGRAEVLWGNLGDITTIASLIREMKKRDAARHG